MADRQAPSEPDPARTVAPPKLRVPTPAPPVVKRDRLLRALDEHTSAGSAPPPITVVTGPAGSGKTTALATWAARRAATNPVGWVSLDAHDNAPAYLWTAITEALRTVVHPPNHPASLPPATSAAEPDHPAAVIAALDRATTPVCLVVDDVHVLTDRTALRGLELLVRHTPAQLRLVLAGRSTPPLRLSRLRLEGRLREVDGRQLAFTRQEAEALFTGHHVELAPDDVDLVLRRTDGWTAGLRLVALSVAAAGSGEDTPLQGAVPMVSEYLAEEVLGRQPEHVREFMVSTSICDTVCADLAAAVSEQPGTGPLLHDLSRANSLVTAVEGAEGWYRYHPMLREHLLAELDRSRPRDRPRLHHIAATWHRDAGRPLTALEHAVQAEHPDLIGDLVGAAGLGEILRSDGDRLHDLLKLMPATAFGRPVVALIAAFAALERGNVPLADWLTAQVDNPARALKSDHARALHATVRLRRARFDGECAEALAAMRTTTAGRTGDLDLDVAARLNRGIAELWRGEHEAADEDLYQGLRLAAEQRLDHAVLLSLVHLAALACARGDLAVMVEHASRAVEFAVERHWERKPGTALAYALLAVAAHQRLDDVEASRLASLGAEVLSEPTDRTVELTVASAHAVTAFQDAGDPHAVVAALWRQWDGFQQPFVAAHLVASVAPAVQRMALRVGEHQWAGAMAPRIEAALGPCGEHALLSATVQSHRVGQARKLIEPVLSGELPCVAASTLIDVWLLEATLAEREGAAQQAHEAVRRALSAAEPLNAVRPFLEAGKPIRDLLATGAGRFGRLDRYATTVMLALPTAGTGTVDGLTVRERDLLVELPSMRTAEEIANSMFVSVNTVKTHLRGIYRKLGVSQRRDAVVVARQRGLI
ncbi:AAA family ATPase [Saccharothrix syringae]|uniref:HTH luxR-type domain-containing protein n=1 Tax=Saccharothrix syringae TaxID=103733 RepID=A0A5Q0H0A3_SACSY|nr:AAA family ATPase [Saccharothrix syringae]QFZ19657.1 hypothetical protein EKG83_21455 [Saccharothrix syringae]